MTIRRPNPVTLVSDAGDVVDFGGAVAGAEITVSAEGATTPDTRDITVQLLDGQGNAVAKRGAVQLAVLADANGDAFAATGGSTGIAIGAAGALLPLVAKKLFQAISENDGVIDLTWLDTGTEAAYLAVILPNGSTVISDPLTNA